MPREARRSSSAGRRKSSPASAPAAMIATWVTTLGASSAAMPASTATVARGASGQRVRAMPQSACATTAAATTFSPCSAPAGIASS